MRVVLLLFIIALNSGSGIYAAGSHSDSPAAMPFKSQSCRSDFGRYAVSDGSDTGVMAGFLRSHVPNLRNNQTPIKLTFSQVSPGGYHYTFCQTYAGIPIYASEVTVSVSRQNRVYSIFDDSYDISGWNVNMTDFNYQEVPAFQGWGEQYFGEGPTSEAKQVIAFDTVSGAPVLCWQVTTRDHQSHMREALVSHDRVLYERDALMYHHRAAPVLSDSAVTGMVNNPDPLTTAGVVYYFPYMGLDSAYQNFGMTDVFGLDSFTVTDSCRVQLDIQRRLKGFNADFVNDTFYLSSHYIQLANPEGLGFTPATSTTPAFDYFRCDERFHDVMVYYHLNTIRSYVHSLGFNSADTPITADPNNSLADESFFAVPTNSVNYGTGGVPDAEDADVIIHEYTHFISWNSNQSNTGVGQRGGLDEASGDYDAASYSAAIDPFHWYWVFNWDGHNQYWSGRWVNETAVYPDLPTDVQSIWQYGEIWSSSLMQIWWAIGKGPADSMFFQSLYGLGSNITLLDAAQQYIEADSLLFGGKYHCTIVQIFYAHGIAAWDSSCGDFPLGMADIAPTGPDVHMLTYPDGFSIIPAQPGMTIDIDLYDMTGRRLASWPNAQAEIKPEVPDGVYIIQVSAQGYQRGFKWVQLK